MYIHITKLEERSVRNEVTSSASNSPDVARLITSYSRLWKSVSGGREGNRHGSPQIKPPMVQLAIVTLKLST